MGEVKWEPVETAASCQEVRFSLQKSSWSFSHCFQILQELRIHSSEALRTGKAKRKLWDEAENWTVSSLPSQPADTAGLVHWKEVTLFAHGTVVSSVPVTWPGRWMRLVKLSNLNFLLQINTGIEKENSQELMEIPQSTGTIYSVDDG